MVDDPAQKLRDFISDLKFKKKLIGGVDEVDVWKKIEEMHKEYERLYQIQQERYEAIIEHIKGETHE